MLKKPSRQYAPMIYGLLQSAVTAGIATTTAVVSAAPANENLAWFWFKCWGTSWAMMVPVVLFISPLLQKATLSLTAPPAD